MRRQGSEVHLVLGLEVHRIEREARHIAVVVGVLRTAAEVGELHIAVEEARRIVEEEVHHTAAEVAHRKCWQAEERHSHTEFDRAGIDQADFPIVPAAEVERRRVLEVVVDHKAAVVEEHRSFVEVEVRPIHLVEEAERYIHLEVVVDSCYSKT